MSTHPSRSRSLPSASLPSFHSKVLSELGWSHVTTLSLPGRIASVLPADALPSLTPETRRQIEAGAPLYGHQVLALSHHLDGHPVVVATGTGSGKTRIFHLAAVEALNRSPHAVTLALYPGKALAREQSAKWQDALNRAGLATEGDGSVALLTGDHSDKAARLRAFSKARVVVATPDVLHAWCLQRLADKAVRRTLARTALIVVDEAHTLSGVFGSNCLWLFRRLQSALRSLGAPAPRWLAASATLQHPAEHLEALTGLAFKAVTERDDTSPRHACRLHLIRPGAGVGMLPGLGAWLRQCSLRPALPRFVVFTNSRKQTEAISLIGNRPLIDRDGSYAPDTTCRLLQEVSHLAPYRSGLSAVERATLQDRFRSGELRGLVCTSAFELGIDLPGLDLGFLVGLPESPASFWQRLGRFGRHAESDVFLIHDGSARCEAAFAHPESLLDWRARDAALYPENPILIARHVLCLAQENRDLPAVELPAASDPTFPIHFLRELAAFHRGELSGELRDALAAQGNDSPHLAFPLRSIDDTYTFKSTGGGFAPEGTVTYGQILREAYPGAVYYHAGTPWRVTSIDRRRRELTVVREKGYHTDPRTVPANLVPDLARPVLRDLRWAGGLRLIECHGRATEWVTGFSETRGGHPAPGGDYAQGSYGQQGSLFRAFDTTGVILVHPALRNAAIRSELLGGFLREALLLACPREAAEVAAAAGFLKVARRDLGEGTRFVALYDTVPGSLRLTGALGDRSILASTLAGACRLAQAQLGGSTDNRDQATLAALIALARPESEPVALPADWPGPARAQVMSPGSAALHRRRNLAVEIVSVSTDLDGMVLYQVRRVDDPSFQGTLGAEALSEIPGLTTWIPLSSVLGTAA